MLDELIENPEKYRAGDNYRATSVIFPVEFNGEKFVVKRPRFWATAIHTYYALRDVFGMRIFCTGKESIEAEAKKLRQLEGLRVPRFINYNDRILVRQYIPGTDFRQLTSTADKIKNLEEALDLVDEIHGRDIAVGDCHVKNIVAGDDGRTYYVDFDGVFKEDDLYLAKAADIVKFVYNTEYVTRSKEVSIYIAELAARKFKRLRSDIALVINNAGLNCNIPLQLLKHCA